MTDSNIAKIKQRIQALLAKANGTDNEHEAEAFLAKAMELLQQYQLDVANLVDAGDPILNHVGVKGAKSGHAWTWKLYRAVGALYGCKGIYVETGYARDEAGKLAYKKGKLTETYEYRLIGRESSIITADLMYPWIVLQVREHAKRIVKDTTAKYGAQHAMSEQGQAKRVAAALIARIWSLVGEQRTQAPKTQAGKNALIILDQVEAAFKEHYPETVPMRSGKAWTDAASRQAANSIGLHRQTSGKDTLRLA